jgi:hypothetical protein
MIDADANALAGTVVLVEGTSDQRAVEALAGRRGRDLGDDGIAVVAIGGSKNIGRFLDRFGGITRSSSGASSGRSVDGRSALPQRSSRRWIRIASPGRWRTSRVDLRGRALPARMHQTF